MHATRSEISRQWARNSHDELWYIQRKLEKQVKSLVDAALNANEHFVEALLDPDKYLGPRSKHYSKGSFEEMQLVFHYGFSAWWNHEGVLPLVHSAKSLAFEERKEGTESWMNSPDFKNNPLPGSREEILENISRNAMWDYLNDAVRLASRLEKDQFS